MRGRAFFSRAFYDAYILTIIETNTVTDGPFINNTRVSFSISHLHKRERKFLFSFAFV